MAASRMMYVKKSKGASEFGGAFLFTEEWFCEKTDDCGITALR